MHPEVAGPAGQEQLDRPSCSHTHASTAEPLTRAVGLDPGRRADPAGEHLADPVEGGVRSSAAAPPTAPDRRDGPSAAGG